MTLLLLVLFAALVFEYINGFHDTANSIATVVSTKVLTPRQAIMLATFFNLIGALAGTAVAKTIGGGLIDTSFVTIPAVLCALSGAIVWNIFTWWLGLPSSSSHALIGGLCGSALAAAHGNWGVLKWSYIDAKGASAGLWPKVVMPMILSPLAGFIIGALIMYILYAALRKATPRFVNKTFGKLQLVSAAWMGFSHGSNDAQKTMGIIALALFTGTKAGTLDNLPEWLSFLRTPTFDIHLWVVILCALTMAAGTAAGGWRIIKTMGHKMVKLQPVHGFAAETTAAAIIGVASHIGIPLSTTHVISTSIMGVGATKRFSAVKWGIVGRMVWAWILTIPICGFIGYSLMRLAHFAD
ncbi:inorganic phosphate transporter [Nibricoccus aquaticus]|uniref:Inorganic phosphate transporter n=1 Tax=Nibricoccus aquaticus TaxID=2576891 RepID=A0A290Q825_9BACT|nr:inorganic phosphate transporter [Nibricoccus aquaticus]ATC64654.1 inorganic phosphate transporter [Nibricoccus aquaticus]